MKKLLPLVVPTRIMNYVNEKMSALSYTITYIILLLT